MAEAAGGPATRSGRVGTDARFDAFALAREAGVIEGSVDAAKLGRVAERLVAQPVPVLWRIRGTKDAVGRPALRVELDGVVPLECQRCLEPVDVAVAQETELVLAASDAELARLDNETLSEVVLADQPIDALTLVEDELLLALPFVPRHGDADDGGACTPAT